MPLVPLRSLYVRFSAVERRTSLVHSQNFKYSVEQVGKNNPICARLLEFMITTTISARNLLIKANLEPQVPGIEQKYQASPSPVQLPSPSWGTGNTGDPGQDPGSLRPF